MSRSASAAVLDDPVADLIDFSQIDSYDPSLAEGDIIYARSIPFELRLAGADEGSPEDVTCKIVFDKAGGKLKVQLTSESDLFFLYSHNMTDVEFKEFRSTQRLMVSFEEYPKMLVSLFEDIESQPQNHMAVMVLQESGVARIDFIQNAGFKFLELLSIRATCESEDVIRQHIHFRYNSMKARLAVMETRLHEIANMVKLKNPSLLKRMKNEKSGGLAASASTTSLASATTPRGRK